MKDIKFVLSNRRLRVNLILTFAVVTAVAVFSADALLRRGWEINTQLFSHL